MSGLVNTLTSIDKLALIVSCIGHGDFSNFLNIFRFGPPRIQQRLSDQWFFQFLLLITENIAKTDIAIIYSDVSPLENHHCGNAFKYFIFQQSYSQS